MDNYLTQRLELVCANQPVYVPGIPGQKGARGYISVFMNEDWQRSLKPGDENYPVAVVINGFSSMNMEAGKTGPAEFIAGLSKGHTFRAELRVRTKREFIIHPDTKQIMTTPSGAQRYNVVEFRSLGSYFRYGRDGRKFEDEQIMAGIRHYAWDGKLPLMALQNFLVEAQKAEPQGGVQTNLLTALINICNEGPQHETQRRANDRAPYVPGAETFRNATVKLPQANAYAGGAQPNFVQQVQNAVNPVTNVQQGFNPVSTQQAAPPTPPVVTNPLTPTQNTQQNVANAANGFPPEGQY